MARHLKRAAEIGLAAINVEGGLISPEKLAEIAATAPDAKAAADYHCPKGTSLRDEITRYFRIGQAHWQIWSRINKPTVTQTATFTKALLQEAFGFEALTGPVDHTVDGHRYRIAWEAKGSRIPIVVAAPIENENGKPVEAFTRALPEFGDGNSEGLSRRSPVALLQEWLNASRKGIWGLVFAGDRVRLMRDNASFTRPAYIEVDLGAIFRDEMFADFTAIWLLIHTTRFGAEGAPSGDSPLERWREAGQRAGTAARERLRGSVEDTLLALGQGFLDANPDLRAKLDDQTLSMQAWFEQLLRVVYRLIFLAVAEDRDLLLSPGIIPAVSSLYLDGYGFAHLRDRSVRRSAHDHHFDAWEGAKIVFRALERGEKMLGLPALGGLFAPRLTPNLDDTKLSNRAFMGAIFKLSWLMDDNRRVRINWRDMATEELGSVYEGLLELVPVREDHGRTFAFAGGAEAKGNARKISGSYYTPDSLVQTLLDSALDPVLDRAEAEGGADAILALNVIDPACGSGHFLLGAARRMATRVAQLRDNDAPDYPAAMRDVARNCIHGVDRNPMAVELAKVALWIETVEPGKPLGFLDANIQCGDSLIGILDLKALGEGIPDDAYKPLTGDDKETAKWFAKRNKVEKAGQGSFDWTRGGGGLPPARLAAGMDELRHLPEDTVEQVDAKRKLFSSWASDPKRWATKVACDLYTAAFLLPKNGGVPHNADRVTIPTTSHVRTRLGGGDLYEPLETAVIEVAATARAFHWPLAFPEVMIARGGFDVLIGNPPWDVLQFNEEEYFTSVAPEIATLKGAKRKKAIATFQNEHPALWDKFRSAVRLVSATSNFVRGSGRYPLTTFGKLNLYALFAELGLQAKRLVGQTALIVPADILSSDSLKTFFQSIVQAGALKSSIAFENEEFIFPGIANVNRFAIVTLGSQDLKKDDFRFAFFLRNEGQISDEAHYFKLSRSDFALLNPNTLNCPVFRTAYDSNLTKSIFQRVPVFINDGADNGDPWKVKFLSLFNMTTDSELFFTYDDCEKMGGVRERDNWLTPDGSKLVPLYEGKFIWHYDCRFSSYHNLGKTKGRGGRGLPPVTLQEYSDPDFCIQPQYWVRENDVESRIESLNWSHKWLLGWRDVANAKVERTMVPAFIPRYGAGHTLSMLFPTASLEKICCLVANLSTMTLDYLARQKIAGTHLSQVGLKQFPVLPPSAYDADGLKYIVPRVVELTYTSHLMAAFAVDLGYDVPPFRWDEDRRVILRADLDAWFALAYGLTRDELRYILDPIEVMGVDFPSETFRVLKERESEQFGEYQTARFVLAAYDRLISEGMRPHTQGYR